VNTAIELGLRKTGQLMESTFAVLSIFYGVCHAGLPLAVSYLPPRVGDTEGEKAIFRGYYMNLRQKC
jgi:hypothetical protein